MSGTDALALLLSSVGAEADITARGRAGAARRPRVTRLARLRDRLLRPLPGEPHILRTIVLIVVAGICLAVIGGAVLRSQSLPVGSAAAPTISTPSATSPAILTGPHVVSIIGDARMLPSAVKSSLRWPALLMRDIRLKQSPATIVGGGYLAGTKSTLTFSAAAEKVSQNSTAVVFVGGSADAGKQTLTELHAITTALSTAHRRAPNARLIVVGPAWTGPPPPADLLAVGQQLKTSSTITRATWLDPIGAKWFSATPGATEDDNLTVTTAAQSVIADRIGAALSAPDPAPTGTAAS